MQQEIRIRTIKLEKWLKVVKIFINIPFDSLFSRNYRGNIFTDQRNIINKIRFTQFGVKNEIERKDESVQFFFSMEIIFLSFNGRGYCY